LQLSQNSNKKKLGLASKKKHTTRGKKTEKKKPGVDVNLTARIIQEKHK
jgi:hypothetical protein